MVWRKTTNGQGVPQTLMLSDMNQLVGFVRIQLTSYGIELINDDNMDVEMESVV